MELDEVDVEIINSLLEDGCLSLRDLTKVTGLSPPSLNSRLKRLKDSGIIKGSTVLIDRNKVKSGVSAFLLIRCDPSSLKNVEESLSALEDVTEIYRLTGFYNLLVKSEVEDVSALDMLNEEISKNEGIIEVNTHLISEYVKEKHKKFKRIRANLKCEYCGNTISGKPYLLEYRGVTRFFCCPTCLREFRKKYGIA